MKNEKRDRLRKAILKQLYYGAALSLTELSTLTGKSLPLVTNCVNELLADEYVIEHGLARSTGGRRPVTFLLNKDKPRYVAAVAIDQLSTRIVIYNLINAEVLSVEERLIDLHKQDALHLVTTFISDYIRGSKINARYFLGIGIGMPGFINVDKGINYSFLPVEQQTLGEYWERFFNMPVFLDNDSSTIAMAELKFGKAKGLQDVMVVNVGWGIGLGMIVNGQLFRGHSGFAGEFSHIPLSTTNNLCSCGKRGCLEVDASLLIIAAKAKEALANGEKSRMSQLFKDVKRLAGDQLLLAAKEGDPLAVSLLSNAAFMIGKGLATLIHIMNPEKIVLSGRGAMAGKILMAPVHQAINEFCIPRLAEQTGIEISELAYKAELVGAATLVVENCDFH